MARNRPSRLTKLFVSTALAALILFLVLYLLANPARPAAAGTLTVGCSTGELITAINLANSPATSETLVLSEGCTYTLAAVDNDTDGANGLPSITGQVVISGHGATIQRDGAAAPFRLFHVAANGALTMTEVILRDGLLEGNGDSGSGAALFNRGKLSLTAASIISNTSSDFDGGAMVNAGTASALLTQVDFLSNTANLDGGALVNYGGNTTMDQVLYQGNQAGRGGAIMFFSGEHNMEGVTFAGNKSDLGGAIYQSTGNVTITGGRFLGNEGSSGGGAVLIEETGILTTTNVIFANNSGNFGGAIMNTDSTVFLINDTFSGNTADNGGGLAIFDGDFNIYNTIFWANQATEGSQILNYGGTTVIASSLIQASGGSGPGWDNDLGQDGGGNIDANPSFVRLPDFNSGDTGDLHLNTGSPAIDAGDNSPGDVILPAADLDGLPRRDDIPSAADTGLGSPPIVDMGAFEVQNVAPIAVPDAYETDEDTQLLITDIFSGVLANDGDANGDSLSAVLVDDVISGALELQANGTFSYTPATDFYGQDTFSYRASDGLLTSEATVVTITVHSVLDRPLARPDAYVVQPNAILVITVPGVLENDDLGDGLLLTATLESGPQHGGLDLAGDGGFIYTPTLNYTGLDAFSYRADDGLSSSDPVTVTLTIEQLRIYLPLVLSAQAPK